MKRKETNRFKYHYLITVGLEGMSSSKPGQPYVDTFFEYTDEMKSQFLLEQILDNSLTKEEKKENGFEARIINEFKHAGFVTNARKMVHDLRICRFDTDTPWTREDFEMYLRTQRPGELQKILDDASNKKRKSC
jgi:hypothetical protein